MEREPSIAFNGDLTVDHYTKQNVFHRGGSSMTSAIWSTRQGASASVLAAVGKDAQGDAFIKDLEANQVNAAYVSSSMGAHQ